MASTLVQVVSENSRCGVHFLLVFAFYIAHFLLTISVFAGLSRFNFEIILKVSIQPYRENIRDNRNTNAPREGYPDVVSDRLRV